MIEDMGLSGVALRVYALIYSFTKAGSDCHASLNNIAKRVDASTRSIQRALGELVEKGYVIKTTSNLASSNHYVADMDMVGHSVYRQNVQGGDTMSMGGDTVSIGGDTMSNNNKENNKEILTNYDIFDAMTSNDPKGHFGRSRVVRLSYHQYVTLLLRVGFSETFRYIRILEGRILDNPDSVYRNHYKTIVGWAKEDGYISEE